jgi:hypothetical protein
MPETLPAKLSIQIIINEKVIRGIENNPFLPVIIVVRKFILFLLLIFYSPVCSEYLYCATPHCLFGFGPISNSSVPPFTNC